ncbi:hypothetical protein FHG87_008500 [Trinorchestia longiramus]|nr:hypothetical protein FHG87_008500 [Trinorchestia longiramus]
MSAAGFEPGSFRSQADSLTSRPSWWYQSTKLVNVESKRSGIFELLTTIESESTEEFTHDIVHHLSLLKTELKHYFPDVTCCAYVANPFSVDPADLRVGTREQEEFVDIQTDETAKTRHKECSPLNFLVSMASYSTLTRHAVPQLLIFHSTWEYEQGFSAFMTIESKSQNRLDMPDHDFRCAVSKVMPRIDQLVEKKQIQPSH